MSDYLWNDQFMTLFNRCLEQYQRGNYDFNSYYSASDLAFLAGIGCKPRELFDFVEDHGADLPATTALLVATVRRDYFLMEQDGKPSGSELKPGDLPARDAQLAGIPWLPRILSKARAKLRGELNPDIMYGCGGDRMFLESHGISPSDFLRRVWKAGDDDQAVANYVLAKKASL
jgi:hypothetical protein